MLLKWNELLRSFTQKQGDLGVLGDKRKKGPLAIFQADLRSRQEFSTMGSMRTIGAHGAASFLSESMHRSTTLDQFTTGSILDVATEDGDVVHVTYNLNDASGFPHLQKTDHRSKRAAKECRGHLAGRLSDGRGVVFFLSLLLMYHFGVPLVYPLDVSSARLEDARLCLLLDC